MMNNYETTMDYNNFRDMKKYNPDFSEEMIKGKTDEEIRKMFKEFYSNNPLVDLLTWMRVFEPQKGNYSSSYWEQTVFVRDEINKIFYPEFYEQKLNPVKVIGIYNYNPTLPVYYIYLEEYNTQIIMRGNFYNWIVSINSEYSINDINEDLIEEINIGNLNNDEGLKPSHIFENYKDNKKKFTVSIKYDSYKLYVFFYLLKISLMKRKS